MEQAPRQTVRRETNGKIEEVALAAVESGDTLSFCRVILSRWTVWLCKTVG